MKRLRVIDRGPEKIETTVRERPVEGAVSEVRAIRAIGKSAQRIWDMSHNVGEKFREWCIDRGRSDPPAAVVRGLNTSTVDGWEAARAWLRANPTADPHLMMSLQTFLAGSKRRVQ